MRFQTYFPIINIQICNCILGGVFFICTCMCKILVQNIIIKDILIQKNDVHWISVRTIGLLTCACILFGVVSVIESSSAIWEDMLLCFLLGILKYLLFVLQYKGIISCLLSLRSPSKVWIWHTEPLKQTITAVGDKESDSESAHPCSQADLCLCC